MSDTIDISIIIVSWNVENILKNCLMSIYKYVRSNSYEIIVIDNASSDNSVLMIEQNLKDVVLIKNNKNTGFAKACNQGIKISKGKYILLLNPDTILWPGIERIVSFIESTTDIGVVGCQMVNDSNQRMLSYQSFPTLLRIFTFFTGLNKLIKYPIIHKILQPVYSIFPSQAKHRQIINKFEEVDSVSGAFFLCKKELYSKIGLLDESYFMYFEETDFCKRVKKAGYKNYYFPDYRIVHLEGESAKKSKAYLKYYADSLLYYFKKNHKYLKYFLAQIILYSSVVIRISVSLLMAIFSKNARRDLSDYFNLRNI